LVIGARRSIHVSRPANATITPQMITSAEPLPIRSRALWRAAASATTVAARAMTFAVSLDSENRHTKPRDSSLLRFQRRIPTSHCRSDAFTARIRAGARKASVRRRVSSVVTLPCRPWSLARGPTARPDLGETIAPCRGWLRPMPLPAPQGNAPPSRLWRSAGPPKCL
jgi:hypothetical protein